MNAPSFLDDGGHSCFAVGMPSFPMTGCYFIEGSSIIFVNYVLLLLYELSMHPDKNHVYVLTLLLAMMGLTSWISIRELRHTNNAIVISLYRGCMFYTICLSREFSISSEKSVQLDSIMDTVISASNVGVLAAGPVCALVICPVPTISNQTSSSAGIPQPAQYVRLVHSLTLPSLMPLPLPQLSTCHA